MGNVWSGNNFYYDEALRGISAGIYYDTITVAGESIASDSGTLVNKPLVPGSVTLTNGIQTFIDNGSGLLISSLSPHFGTINYTTGAWMVTGWEGVSSKVANYMAATSPSFVNINWDALAYPTIIGLGNLDPLDDRSVAHEIGTLKDASIWTGIEEYSQYVDLIQLLPQKFRSSVALQQLMYVFGIQVGIWIGEINDLQTILDKWSVGEDYIQYLADLVGYQIVVTPTTTFSNMQGQLLNVIDWYKQKGTYQALQVVGYTLGLSLNLNDLYTEDYVNFVSEPWYTGLVGTNPPGLSSSYYKSPHLGIEVNLNQTLGTAPNYYLFDGSNTYNNIITYVERVRPINVVPQYSMFLNPISNRQGTVEGDQYTTSSVTSVMMPENTVTDSGFNYFNVKNGIFTYWTLQGVGAFSAQSPILFYTGYTNSASLTSVGADTSLSQNISVPLGITYWQGEVVTLGAWVFTSVANKVYISVSDGVSAGDSSYHPGDSQWHFITVTYTISDSATYVNVNMVVNASGVTAYFDGAILVQGASVLPFNSILPVNVTLTVGGGQPFTIGQNISVVANTDNQMQGTVASYNPVNGQLVMKVTYVIGSGIYNSWSIIGNVKTITLGEWITSQVSYDSSYSTGTISINNGSSALVGVGTMWTQNMAVGDQIGFGTTSISDVTVWYDVLVITSDTSITLSNNYTGSNLIDSVYVSTTFYDATSIVTHDIAYDASQTLFYQSITNWELGTGNVGVIPGSNFSLQDPVMTNAIGWDSNYEVVTAPITVNIQGTYVEYSFQLPNTLTQNSLTELGLYTSSGALMLGSTFPAISLVPGESLRVVVHVNY